ncbi:hypothetical protein NL676_005212 [Syzygium grande]|nr:hypothetical protein NL676_005212 [Syzygium grande]
MPDTQMGRAFLLLTEVLDTTYLNGEKVICQIPPEEYFNMKQSQARNVIERCFGLLKLRKAQGASSRAARNRSPPEGPGGGRSGFAPAAIGEAAGPLSGPVRRGRPTPLGGRDLTVATQPTGESRPPDPARADLAVATPRRGPHCRDGGRPALFQEGGDLAVATRGDRRGPRRIEAVDRCQLGTRRAGTAAARRRRDNEESENHSDVAIIGANQNLPPLPSSQMQNVADSSRRKRAKASDKWAAGLVEIASTFGSFMEKANERMEMIASRIGHAKDLDDDKRKINEELLKMSLDTMDRIKLCRKIVKDPENIHLFFGFQGDDRKAFVDMLLQEMIEE